MSTAPQPETKSGQYEFGAEENRTLGALADSMKIVATLMKIVGLVFLIFFGLTLYQAVGAKAGYGPAIGLGAAALFCLSIGFRTSGASHSFRRVVESQNRDVWHLMNALRSLHGMYSLLRTIILGTVVLLVIGLALALFEYL